MDQHACQVLEFVAFLELLSQYASCDLVRRHLQRIEPCADLRQIRQQKPLCLELLGLLSNGAGLPRLQVPDMTPILRRVRPQDAVLSADDLVVCRQALQTTQALARFQPMQSAEEVFPIVHRLQKRLNPMQELRDALEKAFSDEGELQDAASPALKSIRQRIVHTEQQIRQTLDRITRASWAEDVLQEKFITIRNGRHVVPVRREMKNRFPGVVHDHSDSGRTLFMEPSQTLPLGNELTDLLLEERDECRRILAGFSSRVRYSHEDFSENQRLLVRFAAAEAIALWADDYQCTFPAFGNQLALNGARHPLLEHQFRTEEGDRRVVPLDLVLGSDTTTLAITGSNSGGKTVTLKTVGLLVLIAQAGLPVPVEEDSCMPLFENVFADIGDEQSIVQNLSTFTGHLTQINHIFGELDASPEEHALVLLDELGTGTDPLEGGALACAILKELTHYQTLTMATTHLGSIKTFVHEHERMENAAVRFNTQTLQPEYALDVGNPGSSHALRVAERLGLKRTILDGAKAYIGTDHLHLEGVLAELDEQRRQSDHQRRETQHSFEQASQDRARLQEELQELRTERKKKLHDAYTQAEQIVANTRKQMERLIAEITHDKVDETAAKDAAHAARAKLDRKLETLTNAAEQTQTRPGRPVSAEQLKPGDEVWVEKLTANAKVVKVKAQRNQVIVRVGQAEFTVSASEVGRAEAMKPPAERPRVSESRPRISPNVRPEINLIGQRVEEAQQALEHYLDDANLAGLTEVRVIHGLGTGRLKAGVHRVLQGRRDVNTFREGIQGKDGGGPGVTIAELKTT